MVAEQKNDQLDKKSLEFQITDWNSYHEIDHLDEEKYVIQLFGRTADDKDVCLKVCDYSPYFYLEVPLNWKDKQADIFVESLKSKVSWRTSNNPSYDYDLSESLTNYKLIDKHKFYNFTNNKYYKFLWLVFKSHTGMREFSNVLTRAVKEPRLTREPTIYQRYEANIEPHIRFMHTAKLSSCGWVSVDMSKLKPIPEYSKCDHSYSTNWKFVGPADNDDRMAPLKIMGYDIECISCDINFPQAERKPDKAIQIGMTMYRYGSMECYERQILTLKHCAPIDGAVVECYKTEKGLIRGWAKKVSEIRPDVMAGYNNFGFDDNYIFDRIARIDRETAAKQGCTVESLEPKFMDEILQTIGKVNNKYLVETEQIDKTVKPMGPNDKSTYGPSLTYFQVKNLSSSALGDNELSFFQVPGILSIDVMKVIQRDHRLVGYKLDNVSANFITEDTKEIVEGIEVDGIVPIQIFTNSTKALSKNSYIQVMVDDGYSLSPLNEGAKYFVKDIQTATQKIFDEKEKKEKSFTVQCIHTDISAKELVNLREVLANPLLRKCWTFAKDDMHHTLINKYFREGKPKRIAQIAKYCLKDCELVNLLLSKLEIIVNSVGMAKVCHVPLSYLFLRGQGVKIFSLVSKKCREKGFLIPTLRSNKKDNNGDDDLSYEGATVITPRPGIYISPIGVLDYSSLYPNSMRERNLSPECYVNDPKYDNLPGWIYHDVAITLKDKKGKIIRNIDGTPKIERHRFAQKIITDEEIEVELKDVFKKINDATDKIVEQIGDQEYWTEAQRTEKIAQVKTSYDKTVSDINDDTKSTAKIKDKKLAEAKAKLDKEVGEYIKLNNEIAEAKKVLEEKIAKTKDEKLIEKIKAKLKAQLAELDKSIPMTDPDKEALIKSERSKAAKKIADEKAKKYNVVNGQTVKYGILPEILTELLNKRKETNNRLASEKDPFVKAILNSLQLAFKVTANSLYGQTGAPTSPIFFIAIAASTTAIGRERLHYAKKIVEENFKGSEVIYGDSVTADTPVVVKHPNNDIRVTTIDKLDTTGKWHSYQEFHQGDTDRRSKLQAHSDCEIWTVRGWSKINRIIKHKTKKRIFRVGTDLGCVDVTEDHSLLDENGAIIKPTECRLGTNLLNGFTDDLTKLKFSDIYSKLDFVDLLISKQSRYITDNKLDAQTIYCGLKVLNYHVKISLDDSNKFVLDYSREPIEITNGVKSVEFLRYTGDDEYVYDLETADGTFGAGIGSLIVKNTDSIFINFHIKDENGIERTDKEALIKTISLCNQAADIINKQVPKPQSIVYEKTFHPFILVAKKKYVGLLFEKDPTKYKLKAMGIVLKRRDNAPIVKIVVGGIINHILKNRDVEKALEYAKEVLAKLMAGKYPMDKFIISKTLKARYKKPSAIAHKVLADRMALRDPGNKPQINDRIPFVYIVKDFGKSNKKKKDVLQGDLIEHPDFVVKNKLQIDYLYYLEHQIIKPATQILELMMPTRQVDKLFNKYIIEEENKRKGRQSMEKWMDFSKVKKKEADIEVKIKIQSEPTRKTGKFANMPYIGNTKRLEKKSMNQWLQQTTTTKSNSEEWKPTCDKSESNEDDSTDTDNSSDE